MFLNYHFEDIFDQETSIRIYVQLIVWFMFLNKMLRGNEGWGTQTGGRTGHTHTHLIIYIDELLTYTLLSL